jgi:aminocarboxymuconate-semialdehyde decarboxylase
MPDPRVALGQLLYDTVLNSPAALRLLIDEVGAERVLLGTDDPFEGGDPTPRATVDAVPGLSARGGLLLLGGNAERLFEGIRRPTDRPSLSGSARL